MADPLTQFTDVALRLCIKLHWLCSEMQDTPKTISRLHQDLQQQLSIAQDIRATHDRILHAAATAPNATATCLEPILDDYLQIMKALLVTLKSVVKKDSMGAFRQGWNAMRAIYKKNEMLLLCDHLDRKKGFISMWLSNANFKLSQQIHCSINRNQDKTAVILKTLEADISKSNAHLPPLVDRVETISNELTGGIHNSLEQQQQIITTLNQTTTDVSRLTQEWGTIAPTLRSLNAILNHNPEFARTISQTVDGMNQRDSLHGSNDEEHALETIKSIHQHNDKLGLRSRTSCTCRAIHQTTQMIPLSFLHFRKVFKRYHFRSCPKSKYSENSLEFMMRIVPPSWLLRHTINLSIVVQNWSTHTGFSMSPLVIGTSRLVDRTKSPSFLAVQRTWIQLNQSYFENSPIVIDDLKTTLEELFMSQQASPLDEDCHGNTLLSEIICIYYRRQAPGVGEQVGPGGHEYVSLIQYLLRSGANPNYISSPEQNRNYPFNLSGTAIDQIAYQLLPEIRLDLSETIYRSIVDEGGVFSRPINDLVEIHPHFWFIRFPLQVQRLRRFPEQLEICGYSDLVTAIIQQSVKDFQRLLRICDLNHESPITRLRAIHFAVMWPLALQQLISAGADVNCEDDHGRRPIHLAVALGQISAVEILLKADCALITPEKTQSLLQSALGDRTDGDQWPIEISHLVIDGLIDRHKRLRNLAFSVLPDSSPVRQRLSDSFLIESLAPTIIHELRENDISILRGLELDGKDIYDTCSFHSNIRLTPTLAERLWVGGFRRINDYFDHDSCAQGLTPILSAWYNADFEMVSWFISKGASPFSKQHKLPISGLHVYAQRLSFPGGYFHCDIERVHTSMIHLERLMQEGTCYSDNCSCICSPQGCTPVSIFIKSTFIYSECQLDYDEFCTGLTKFWKKLLPGSTPKPEQLEQSLIALTYIRFRWMKQHTCCYIGQDGRAELNSWSSYIEIGKKAINPECDFETILASRREIMAKRHCPQVEKPVCAVYRDVCRTIVDGDENEK